MFNLFKKNKKMFLRKPANNSIFEEWVKTGNVKNMFQAITRLPDPDIVLKKTGKGRDSLEKLLNHYQVGACVLSRKAGTTSKLWSLEREKTKSKKLDFYKDIFLNKLDIHKLTKDILDSPLFGFNPLEITWEKDGKLIIPNKIEAKPRDWFYFNTQNEFFFNHKEYKNGLLITDDLNKFLVPRYNPTYANPYGLALLSRCFWLVAFINGGLEFWIKFTEKYGMPFMVGKYDRSMTDLEKEELLEALVNAVQDAVTIIPNDGAVDIMEANKSSSCDIYDKLIKKCENNISKAILGQTLTTDIGTSGSYAASHTHMEVRKDIIDEDVRLVESSINKLIGYINRINFNETDVPKFCLYDEEDVDQALAERDNKLFSIGIRFTKQYIMKNYGLEEGDFEIYMDKPTEEQGQTQEFEQDKKEELKQLEDMLENLSQEDYDKMVEPLIKPIVDFFDTTKDTEATIEKLAEVFPDMQSEELEKELSKIIFLSEIYGRLNDN